MCLISYIPGYKLFYLCCRIVYIAKIVTVINFKGGVGKTTVSVEIATALARFYGKKTLLVDLDPQASATFYVMEQDRWAKWKSENGSTCDLFDQQHRSFPIRRA